jgi:glucose/arabinose dehydrogenase
MRVLPASRRYRLALAAAVVAVAATAPLWYPRFQDLLDQIRIERSYDGAADRTSPASPVGGAVALPDTRLAPTPTGTDPAVALEPVADLPMASAVVDLPGDGPVLVTTLDGLVHLVDLDTGDPEVVLDLTAFVTSGGERGLLGAAADPAGERLYLNYTNDRGDNEIRSWSLDGDRPTGGPEAGVLHLTIGQPFPNHNGGHLAFGPDGVLWVGTGDGGGGGDPGGVAQDPDDVLGKLLRIVPLPDGGAEAPSTNAPPGDRPEVWAIGLRNPWRYSFDRDTGRLWIADVGQDEAEEVSVVDPSETGLNFGWDRVEGDLPFDGEAEPGFTAPVATYTHADGCSIAGGYVYRGSAIPGLHGWYLFGDFCGGWVRAMPADDPAVEPVELLSDLGPVIAFAELDDGELLVLTGEGISALVAPPG